MVDHGVVWGTMRGFFSCDVEEKVLKEKGFEIVEPDVVEETASKWKTVFVNYSKSVPVISGVSYPGNGAGYFGGEGGARHAMLRASQYSHRKYIQRTKEQTEART